MDNLLTDAEVIEIAKANGANQLNTDSEFIVMSGKNLQATISAIIAKMKESEPVAWRWKPKNSNTWIYDPNVEWLNSQNDVDKEPLYLATPPAQSTNDALRKDEALAKFIVDACNSYLAPVNDALEKAAKIAEAMPLKCDTSYQQYRGSDDCEAISWDISHAIRALNTKG